MPDWRVLDDGEPWSLTVVHMLVRVVHRLFVMVGYGYFFQSHGNVDKAHLNNSITRGDPYWQANGFQSDTGFYPWWICVTRRCGEFFVTIYCFFAAKIWFKTMVPVNPHPTRGCRQCSCGFLGIGFWWLELGQKEYCWYGRPSRSSKN